VRAALIGGGDEGGVLVGEHNPDFLKFVAVCDIRPSNMRRIFEGDPKAALRKGFKKVYGKGCETQGNPDYIAQFADYDAFLDRLRTDKSIEAVVVALPLHLHAKASIDAMKIGQERGKPIHVLCEKLMAWNIQQCKAMIKVAKETNSILSIGHQRHYSMLYAHAQEILKAGTLGDIKHIRALWHRNFTWPYKHDDKAGKQVPGVTPPAIRDGWFQPVLEEDYNALKDSVTKYHYDNVEQLIRWRLYAETGGGLMAELGSHQLDACSIFLGKVHPLAIQGFGGKLFFGPGKNDRNIDDHVFATYEFPGKGYFARDDKGAIRRDGKGKPVVKDRDDVVVVTYSSISTNSFEVYGECLMGSRGTLIVEAEQRALLFAEKNPAPPKNDPQAKTPPRQLTIDTAPLAKAGAATDSWASQGGAAPVAAGSATGGSGPISRGYREEMEDFAYCVRLWPTGEGANGYKDGARLPRCHGEVAMADAIVALTANRAFRERSRIEFKDEWFEAASAEVPDDPKSKPKVPVTGA
jgi:predicted dehydrogenase